MDGSTQEESLLTEDLKANEKTPLDNNEILDMRAT